MSQNTFLSNTQKATPRAEHPNYQSWAAQQLSEALQEIKKLKAENFVLKMRLNNYQQRETK